MDSISDLSSRVLSLFEAALTQHGYAPDEVIPDGDFHRFPRPDKDRGFDAFYKLVINGASALGAFGHFGDDTQSHTFKWPEDQSRLTPEQRAQLDAEQHRLRAELKVREEGYYQEGRERAARLWKEARTDSCDQHPYIQHKGLTRAYGCRVYGQDLLLVPMRDSEGRLQTVLRIWPDGAKKLLDGPPKQGAFFQIGTALSSPTYLVEGFATGASVHEATGKTVICVGDCGNLQTVALALTGRHPALRLIAAGDNDHATKGNPGARAAKATAEALRGDYVLPDFTGLEGVTNKHTDWNDLAALAGVEVVKEQLLGHLKASDAKVFAELAALPAPEYDRVRKAKAKALDIRVETLDRERAKVNEEGTHTETPPIVADCEPWPEAVDGAALLDALESVFRAHVVMPEGGPEICALWTLFTYCFDHFPIAPLLVLTSPQKRCGKTTVVRLMSRLTRRPLACGNISPAAVFRSIDLWQPTLIMDEADRSLTENPELNGIINASHTRDTSFVIRTVGDDHEPKKFNVWAPKLIAGIGRQADTLEDRSIILAMKRRLPSESVKPLRMATLDDYVDLPRQCVRWSNDDGYRLRSADPAMPSGLNDRAQDNWLPLLAIADLAGGHWPSTARRAASLYAGTGDDDDNLGVQLLRDIREVFIDAAKPAPTAGHQGEPRLFTRDLIARLCEREDRPWATLVKSQRITPRRMATLLKPFGVRPNPSLRIGDEVNSGYGFSQFNDAFSRYVESFARTPLSPPTQSPTLLQTNEINRLEHNLSPTQDVHVGDKNESNSLIHKDCRSVGDRKGGKGEDGAKKKKSGSTSDELDPESVDSGGQILADYGVQVRMIDGLSDAAIAVDALLAVEGVLGLDIETTPLPDYAQDKMAGLDPYRSRIRLVQVYDTAQTVYVFDLNKVPLTALAPLWAKPMVAHNAVFEYKHLYHAGVAMQNLHCSMLAGRCVIGECVSLAALAKRLLGITVDKSLQVSDWSAERLTPAQLNYAALDAVLAQKLLVACREPLKTMGQVNAYTLFQRLIPVIARQELTGVPFDVEAHKRLVDGWIGERDTAEMTLREHLGPGVNINSGAQLSQWLQAHLDADQLAAWPRTAKGQLSTDQDTLAQHADLPLVQPLLTYKHAAKRLSTYGDGYREHVSPVTGRLHPSYLLGGTAIGKFSCRNPNIMQLPREDDFRALIAAPAGRSIVCADYNQLELRIAALLSLDRAMLAAYRQGEDLHTKTAALVAGIPPEAVTKEQRQAAKAMNFGLLYGMGAAGLRNYAKANYGVEMGEQDAENARERFFHAYPGLRRWQLALNTKAEESLKVYSKLGRIRDFSLESGQYRMTEALNTAVASTAADVLICALGALEEEIKDLDASLIIHVHDEILLETSEEHASLASEALKRAMIKGWAEVFPEEEPVGLVEAAIGHNWAEAKG